MKIPRSSADHYRKAVCEGMLVRQHFPVFATHLRGNRLVCRGQIQPTESSRQYRIEVAYEPWDIPEIRVLEPEIKPHAAIHIYKEGPLCVYYWKEQPWLDRYHLHETVIPWTAEWLVFYELYLLTGIWYGKSATNITDKPGHPSQPSENERATTN